MAVTNYVVGATVTEPGGETAFEFAGDWPPGTAWHTWLAPTDCPVVAAALALSAGIWTNDNDCLGTGVATWTTEMLQACLDRSLIVGLCHASCHASTHLPTPTEADENPRDVVRITA